MAIFSWIIFVSILESLVSLIGRSIVFLGENRVKKFLHYFISFAIGTLLGVAFLDILPEALEFSPAKEVFSWTLAGFFLFFLLERFLFWYHCHEEKCDFHAAGYLNLIGDAVHNFIDGIIITLAFVISIPIGIATAIAVITHEVPQEFSDFLILIHSGFSRNKALAWNFLVALTTPVGAIIAYLLKGQFEGIIGPALGMAAGNFIYIAASDLIPELHTHIHKKRTTILQIILIALGIFAISAGGSIF